MSQRHHAKNSECPTLAHSLHRAFVLNAPKPFVGSKSDSGDIEWKTFEDMHRLSVSLADAFIENLHLSKGSVVGICSDNCPEWLLTDFACCFNNFMSVGLHTSWTPAILKSVIENSGVSAIVCSSSQVHKFLSSDFSNISALIVLGDVSEDDGAKVQEWIGDSPKKCVKFSEIVSESSSKERKTTYTGAGNGIVSWFGLLSGEGAQVTDEGDDVFTLLYTSGTTGVPKGVAVTKKRWLADADSNKFPGMEDPVVVSYMSLAHGGDRGICWQALFAGARIGISHGKSAEELLADFELMKPSFLLCMSHLWVEYYAIYRRELEAIVVDKIRESNALQHLISSCADISKFPVLELHSASALSQTQFDLLIDSLKHLDSWKAFIDSLATVIGVKEQLRVTWFNRFGGNVFIPVTGGGFTSDEVLDWITYIFMPVTTTGKSQSSRVKNAYGSSEFPGVSVNGVISDGVDLELVPVPEHDHIELNPDGSVLRMVKAGERFDPRSAADGEPRRGEIRVKYKNRSNLQYWNNPTATAAAVKDGWYYMGDIGELDPRKLDENGKPTLRILDRVTNMAELYVNGDSVWIEQAKLEGEVYSQAGAVQHVCILADRNEDSIVAVVVPRKSVLDSFQISHRSSTSGEIDINVAVLESIRAVCLQSLVSAAKLYSSSPVGRPLASYEVPVAVIVDFECWTTANLKLTPTGKPRRDVIRKQFLGELETIYSRKHSAPAVDSIVERSVTEELTSFWKQSPRTVSVFNLPTVVEFEVELHGSLSFVLQHFIAQVGPASVASSGWPLGWKGYLVQDEAIPTYPDSTSRDYLAFRFNHPDAEKCNHLNSLLDSMRTQVVAIRSNSDNWTADIQNVRDRILERCQVALQNHNAIVEAEFDKVSDIVHSSISSGSEVSSNLFVPLFTALTDRLVVVRKLYAELGSVRQHPEKEEALREYNRAAIQLQSVAPRYGIRVPLQIAYGSWFSATGDIEESVRNAEKATLSQSLGEAKVWCSWSGDLIESDVNSSKGYRWHCLDLQNVDRALDSHQFVQKLVHLASELARSGVTGWETSLRLLEKSYPVNPISLPLPDLLQGKGVWVQENLHFWHLRNLCEQQLVKSEGGSEPFISVDTPATFICEAFTQYANRLSIGIPDPDNFLFDDSNPAIRFPHSPMVTAAGLDLVRDNGYMWLTYAQLGSLVFKTATFIRSLVPPGSFVGISGYNGIEWAVCDLACAMAGCVSVGIHTTFDTASAVHALTAVEISLLFCSNDTLFAKSEAAEAVSEGDKVFSRAANSSSSGQFSFWSFESAWKQHTSEHGVGSFPVKHVVLIDESDDKHRDRFLSIFDTSSDSAVSIHSIVDYLSTPIRNDRSSDQTLKEFVSASNPRRDAIFTILFTSGSVGRPKGVVVTGGSFFNDICSRNYIEPLITASYIPLSHSSDRLKMWEFLGNGGRIGIAYFSPANWLDHETTKKNESVQSSGQGSNNVEGLFRQIRRLQPSAMACPPNIWNGLYYLYQTFLMSANKITSDSIWNRLQSFLQSLVLEEPQVKLLNAALRESFPDLPDGVEINATSNVVDIASEAVRSLFGSRIKFLVTGGGPTSREVIRFVKNLFQEITFADSYGATECGAITSNGQIIREKRIRLRLGPVNGESLDNVGEMWVNSPNMSSGYYRDEVRTADCFVTDSSDVDSSGKPRVWYKTGDLVRISNAQSFVTVAGERYWNPTVTVLGRLQSAIRLRSGAVVSPDVLEGIYAVSPLLSQIYLLAKPQGEHLVAVIVWNHLLADRVRFVSGASEQQILREEMERIAQENDLQVDDIPSVIHIEAETWTVENGMMNASFKKQRAAFLARYGYLLDAAPTPSGTSSGFFCGF